MSEQVTVAEVHLWGTLVGYVAWKPESGFASFEYDLGFLNAPVEPSPLKMPKQKNIYEFRALNKETFKGLPGMLSDSLPDKFGNALIDVWLAKNGRRPESFNPVERLCYIGTRGMGALEFKPTTFTEHSTYGNIEVKDLVALASEILSHRENFKTDFHADNHGKMNEALTNLLVMGTSAGGARAKCLVAYNEQTGEVRSGQIKTTPDFSYWLLKLDGVSNNKDKELLDPKGFGHIEYSYYLMAKDCGIEMSDCRLLNENKRAHFMTKRFDRLEGGQKLHMQSLCAIGHYDFNMAGAYSYEQVLQVIREVVTHKNREALEQQFRRTVFNVIGRNQDDHTKNIAFLMDKSGEWKLSPAFDMSYSYNPEGQWTSRHQMSVNGKRDGFTQEDLLEFAAKADINKTQAKKIISQISEVFCDWKKYSETAGVFKSYQDLIQKHLRLDLA